jgi:hypothetical protein
LDSFGHEIAEILLKVALNTKYQNQSIKSIRCTFCEISIEFYSTSTEDHFGQLIKQKVSKKLFLLITIFIIQRTCFKYYIHYLASKEIKYFKTLRIIYYDENPVASHASK